jgi:hypothetical protein
VEKTVAMNRELKHAMAESDKKASDLACAQRTLKTLENLEKSCTDPVAQAPVTVANSVTSSRVERDARESNLT